MGNKFTAICFVSMFMVCLCSAERVSAAMADRIVAVVNNEPIMQSEVEDVLAPIYFDLKEEYSGQDLMRHVEETRIKVLNQMIEDQLIYQEAEKLGVKVEEHEIDEMVDDFKQQFANEEEMSEALTLRGLTIARLRISYRKQIAIRKMHAYEVRSKIMISPQKIQAYYEAHKEEFGEKGHWLLSSITIRKKEQDILRGTKSEVEREKIEGILMALRSGKDFSDLARQHSEDLHASKGGEMGAIKMTELMPEIEEAISKLEKGQISDVIETGRSFHIFRLDDKMPGQYKELNDVRDEILNMLYRKEAEERYKAWMEELKHKAYISIK
ncbi:MAG: peptidyl-prolyl cis-trans isomerase [Candidatus Omnitrophica bacterium]|nr:peptidyl-prolyl cis-trans isomerase [Candidatus Omnitrophota bacterium]